MLASQYRFHGHGSLRFVYAKGKVVRSDTFILKYSTNPRRDVPRIAVVISKKVLKSAVARNRVRRRYYEAMRRRLPDLAVGCDLVLIITSPEALVRPAEQIERSIESALTATGLYKQPKN